MTKVRDIMTHNVPKVNSSATILEASKLMNRMKASAVVVVEGEKAVGMFGERGMLRRFVPLNKKPDEVTVGELLVPMLRIDAESSTKIAAKKLVQSGFTRVGVFDKDDKFLGWVTLTDLVREFSHGGLLDALRSHDAEEKDVLCPNCQSALLQKMFDGEGRITMWKCPHCGYAI